MHPISLFLESAYSFSGSNIDIETLVFHAHEKGYKALVLTDKKMHRAFRFYTACEALGIKPIIGLQVHLEGLLSLDGIDVVCYAKNTQGYRNLLKISSLQSYNKSLPLSLFKKYTEHITTMLYPYQEDWHSVNDHDVETVIHELRLVTETFMLAMHPSLRPIHHPRIPTIMVDMVHYMSKEDSEVHQTLRAIFQLPEKPLKNAHFKAIEEFDFNRDSESKMVQFVDEHGYRIEKKPTMLPEYPNPHKLPSKDYLKALSEKGLEKRLSIIKTSRQPYFNRLQEELDSIISLGYADYFLIVWDVIRYAKRQGILVGPGRGSAPGSLVAYALGITDIDPLEHGLLFERFLNKERITMPDIDIDFPDYAREKVIRYTEDKYGKEFVSHICTFGTFLKKSALRDTARVLSIETKYVNEMSRRVENYESITMMIEKDKDAQNRLQQDPKIAQWLTRAKALEGLPRHVSTHAAGIILSKQPIIEYTAIQPGLLEMHQTQYSQEDLEALGLLKMDFLGLRNLSMIEDVLQTIKTHTKETVNLYTVPLNDEKTFEMLRTKSTTGLFQLESLGMRQLIKEMQITHFDDIVTVLALFRPGPMDSKEQYLKRRQGRAKIAYLTPDLKPILESTQGVLLYQEQIMAIGYKIAGYTMTEADLLRRAVSKKDAIGLMEERKNFVSKATKNGYQESLANEIYDYIVKFANYGFNKSHSVAYATIAYWMAYLKTHYPAYFIAVLMQNALGNESQMNDYMEEAFTYNLTLSRPDIRYSSEKFTLIDKVLYYPLLGVKNIGKTLCLEIEAERKRNPFTSYIDFIHRTQSFLNVRAYQFLIYAGALDSFPFSRKTMIDNIEAVIRFKEYASSLGSDEFVLNESAEFSEAILHRYEKEALGFTWFEDPLRGYYDIVEKNQWQWLKSLETSPLNTPLAVIGYIRQVKEIKTKKGDRMAFLTLSDHRYTIEAIVFPNVYQSVMDKLNVFGVYHWRGTLELRQSKRQFIIDRLESLKKTLR